MCPGTSPNSWFCWSYHLKKKKKQVCCVVQFSEGLLQAETGNEEFWVPSVDVDPPADREAGHGFKAQVLCLAAGHFPV